jgi:hypothetical protein
MTRRERLKKLLERRREKAGVTIIMFEPFGDGPQRPVVLGGTQAQRDAILAKWDAEHPNIPSQPPGPWSKASATSHGIAPAIAPDIQQPAGVPIGHDQPIVESGTQPGAPAPATKLTCRCGVVVETPVAGPVTCRSCGTASSG